MYGWELKRRFNRTPFPQRTGTFMRRAAQGAVKVIFETTSQLPAFLRACREAVLMGTTAGSVIMEAIKEKNGQDDLDAIVVYDARGSEITDASLDWIKEY
jgi:hypothetical protein